MTMTPKTEYDIGELSVYRPRWQCIVLLLAALPSRGARSKSEVLEKIQQEHWINFDPRYDLSPYPSQAFGGEARWKTAVALARTGCTSEGLMAKGHGNSWEITTKGLNTLSAIGKACCAKKIDVHHCFLWSPIFKRHMDPDYTPSDADETRPDNIYRDELELLLKPMGIYKPKLNNRSGET